MTQPDDFTLETRGRSPRTRRRRLDQLSDVVRRAAVRSTPTPSPIKWRRCRDGHERERELPQNRTGRAPQPGRPPDSAGLGTRVYYAIQPGYDTHSVQIARHAELLAELAGASARVSRRSRRGQARRPRGCALLQRVRPPGRGKRLERHRPRHRRSRFPGWLARARRPCWTRRPAWSISTPKAT